MFLASLLSASCYTLLILRWHGNTNWLETLYIVPGSVFPFFTRLSKDHSTNVLAVVSVPDSCSVQALSPCKRLWTGPILPRRYQCYIFPRASGPW